MLNIRPFEPTNSEYNAIVALNNLAWPDDPRSVQGWRHYDTSRNPKYLYQRHMLEDEDVLLGFGVIYEPHWSYQPGKYGLDYTIHPDCLDEGLDRSFYDFALAQIGTREPQPVKLVTDAREDQPERIAFIRDEGFVQTMRYPRSHLDVTTFDAAPFAGVAEKVRSQGIEIVTLTDLRQRDPAWKRKLYDLEWEIDKDVPQPDPPTRSPFEQYEKRFSHPDFRPEGWFIALDGDDCVGLSNIWYNVEYREKVYVGLTGVLRSHRRRGIATALKLPTVEYTRQQGGRIIETDNEENNPMYDLNLKLGFRSQPAWLDFEKVL